MFRERNTTKKRHVASPYSIGNTTLDARHQDMLARYRERQDNLASLKRDLETSEQQMAALERKIQQFKAEQAHLHEVPGSEYEQAWSEFIATRERSHHLRKEVKTLEDHLDEIEYFEKTSDILFEYYCLLTEQGDSPFQVKNIPPPQPIKKSKKGGPPPGKDILQQLMLVKTATAASTSPSPAVEPPPSAAAAAAATGALGPAVAVEEVRKDKTVLVEEYLARIDPQQLRKGHTVDTTVVQQLCSYCKTEYTMNYYEGIMYCTSCGQQEVLLVEQNRPAQKQQNKETSHFSYKRINHFNEWLSQLQGKESTEIPEEIFDSILNEIRKERITDPSKITYAKMREILKRLKINKYYEHIPYIMNRIHGVPTPHFSPELEEKLRLMFKEIQSPFLRHCPSTRRNFLSYSYVLFKLCQLLGQTQYLKYFPLLKSREKLAAQDSIWKDICKDLGWSYVPSV